MFLGKLMKCVDTKNHNYWEYSSSKHQMPENRWLRESHKTAGSLQNEQSPMLAQMTYNNRRNCAKSMRDIINQIVYI